MKNNTDAVMSIAKEFATFIGKTVTGNPEKARFLTWFTPKAVMNEEIKEMASQPTITIE